MQSQDRKNCYNIYMVFISKEGIKVAVRVEVLNFRYGVINSVKALTPAVGAMVFTL